MASPLLTYAELIAVDRLTQIVQHAEFQNARHVQRRQLALERHRHQT
ncbi:hypothetical protein C7446_0444 [Kushneria sinocarnis]|uniref:Uncharacterized protein n=1 Tax=Kushneria sinocarnis TaxID=595502 RepID=A0A420X194_9GAMM|nr:hypothetical protein C7446_0444 [Kushneria sinocarnis]